MKRIKLYALGLLSAGLLTVGLYACSNDDRDNSRQESEQLQNTVFSAETNIKIGRIEKGKVKAFFNPEDFKREFLKYDLLEEIESVELSENYLTIIGKDKQDFSLVALQVKLEKVGSDLYFPSFEDATQVLTTNKCSGNSCSSCDFTRNEKKEITGCKCDSTGTCNHTKTDEGNDGLDTAEKVISIISAIISTVVILI